MAEALLGVFTILHGLVHLLYLGQSWRFFELQPGMVWPDGSWSFSRIMTNQAARSLAGVLCAMAAIAFTFGGIGILVDSVWWRPVVVGAAIFSSIVVLLFWDGQMRQLDNQGAIAVVINAALLIVVLALGWPAS